MIHYRTLLELVLYGSGFFKKGTENHSPYKPLKNLVEIVPEGRSLYYSEGNEHYGVA